MFASIGHRIFSWLQKQDTAYLRSKMQVGRGVEIKRGLQVHHPRSITLGNYVSIGANVTMQAQAPIAIGDYTLIAAGVALVTANHDMQERDAGARHTHARPILIGSNCWLGTGVIVLPGVTIGDGAIVGAGSVVSRDLPPEMICAGVPAKPIKERPKRPDR